MDCNMPGFPVHRQLPKFAQTHVHQVSDAKQPSHPLLSPSPPALNFSQHQGLFQWVSSSHQVARVLEPQLQHQSFQWILGQISFRMDWFNLLSVQRTLRSLLQHHSSKASIIYFSVISVRFSSVQSLSRIRFFATPWTAARQASLSITNPLSPPKPTSIESVMPSNHLILCCPLLLLPSIFPASGYFPMSQFFTSGGQSIRVSASASVLPMKIQDWFPLGWTGWLSLQSKGLSRVFSNTTVHKHQFFGAQLSSQSNSHIHTWPLKKP